MVAWQGSRRFVGSSVTQAKGENSRAVVRNDRRASPICSATAVTCRKSGSWAEKDGAGWRDDEIFSNSVASNECDAVAHGIRFHEQKTSNPLGGPVPHQPWSVRALLGDIIVGDADSSNWSTRSDGEWV